MVLQLYGPGAISCWQSPKMTSDIAQQEAGGMHGYDLVSVLNFLRPSGLCHSDQNGSEKQALLKKTEKLCYRADASRLSSLLFQPPYLPRLGVPQATGGSRKHSSSGDRRKAVEGTWYAVPIPSAVPCLTTDGGNCSSSFQ